MFAIITSIEFVSAQFLLYSTSQLVGHFYWANNEHCRQDRARQMHWMANLFSPELHSSLFNYCQNFGIYAAAWCLHSRKIPKKLKKIFETLAGSSSSMQCAAPIYFAYAIFWVLNIEINFQFTLFMQVWCAVHTVHCIGSQLLS